MNDPAKHVILIGFKHVGKSVLGKKLAKVLRRPFIDLDNTIEELYQKQFQKQATCRTIMQEKGEAFFRGLESEALVFALVSDPAVVSVGGGAPLRMEDQARMRLYNVVHVTAPRKIVYERIMSHGRPAFFDPKKDPFDAFNQLWVSRESIYKEMAKFSVNNDGSIDEAIVQMISILRGRENEL